MPRWERQNSSEIPKWFWEAVETPAESHCVEIDECDVAYRTWGNRSLPPVLLIHGMNAHSHWWDFVAPRLINEFFVVAMDLTGMGDSDYRYEYSAETYSDEIIGVLDANNLDNDAVVVGHSFGGRMALKAAGVYPTRFKALVLVDSGIHHPDEPEPDYPQMGGQRTKVYPDRATAEARFRLFPPQPCDNEYLLKYIAKQSLMVVEGGGYAWKFDEELPLSLKGAEANPHDFEQLSVKLALIYGEHSASYTERTHSYVKSLLREAPLEVMVPNAQHHVFLDQPDTFTTELRHVLQQLHAV